MIRSFAAALLIVFGFLFFTAFLDEQEAQAIERAAQLERAT